MTLWPRQKPNVSLLPDGFFGLRSCLSSAQNDNMGDKIQLCIRGYLITRKPRRFRSACCWNIKPHAMAVGEPSERGQRTGSLASLNIPIYKSLKAQIQAARDALGTVILLGEQALIKQAQAQALRNIGLDAQFGFCHGHNGPIFGLQTRHVRRQR